MCINSIITILKYGNCYLFYHLESIKGSSPKPPPPPPPPKKKLSSYIHLLPTFKTSWLTFFYIILLARVILCFQPLSGFVFMVLFDIFEEFEEICYEKKKKKTPWTFYLKPPFEYHKRKTLYAFGLAWERVNGDIFGWTIPLSRIRKKLSFTINHEISLWMVQFEIIFFPAAPCWGKCVRNESCIWSANTIYVFLSSTVWWWTMFISAKSTLKLTIMLLGNSM